MKREMEKLQPVSKMNERNLRFREIGKGFIMTPPSQDMPKGRRLITAYADQYNRSYILNDGRYELITEQHSYLAMD